MVDYLARLLAESLNFELEVHTVDHSRYANVSLKAVDNVGIVINHHGPLALPWFTITFCKVSFP